MTEAQAYVQDGDVGCGAPGSLSWHKCNLAQLSVDEKISYIRAAFVAMSDADKLEITIFLISPNPAIVESTNNGDGN